MIRVATVTTLRENLNHTLRFVEHNRRIGVDRQYLFFDDPVDPAIDVLKAYSDLCITACNPEHWVRLRVSQDCTTDLVLKQKANANLALEWARADGVGWIAHVDADEFISPFGDAPLPSAIGRIQNNVPYSFLMWAHEAIPDCLEHKDPIQEIRNFRNAAAADRVVQFKIHSALFEGQFLRGHRGKTISRVNEVSKLSVHFAHDADGNKITPVRIETLAPIVVRHYESSSFAAWTRKWTLKSTGEAHYAGNRSRNMQYQLFVDAEKQGHDALKSLYKRLYLLAPDCMQQLKDIGAVVSI